MPGSFSQEQIARKLGEELTVEQNETVCKLILARGGSGSNVRQTGIWADRTLREAAHAALSGDLAAAKAVKIVKQARRLGQAY